MHIFQQHPMCSLGPLGSCNWQRGRVVCPQQGMQKHIHMLSQGVVVATSHTANIHNLSFHDSIMSSSLIASVFVSYMHSHNYKPRGLDTFSKLHDNTCVLGGWHLEPHMLQNMIVDDYLCELQLCLQVVINSYTWLGISHISGHKWS